MATPLFAYQDPFPLGSDDTQYRLLSRDGVSVANFEGHDMLKIAPEALAFVRRLAFDAPAAAFDAAFSSR